MNYLYTYQIMLEAKCLNCGQHYYGFALANPRYQTCDKCGSGLEITDGTRTFKGFSPFTAKDYLADSKEKDRNSSLDNTPQ
jgi:transcription initiation factor IIE alpha subunit